MASKVIFCGDTNMGKVRTNNEDNFICQNIWNDKYVLAVAIDGVGGYEGGEVAAQIAKDEIVNYLERYIQGDRLDLLKQAVAHANNAIFTRRQQDPERSMMSCVLTAALIDVNEKKIHMAHVGDTRLYQYYNNEITKLSHDHSLVGYREEVGDLSEEEAMHHPQRNLISRDVGSEHHDLNDRDFIESETFPLKPNSTLLLCSDGLCDMITSIQMKGVLHQDEELQDKVRDLIDEALVAGGKDNVTVVLVEYQSDEVEKLIPEQTPVIEQTPTPEPSAPSVRPTPTNKPVKIKTSRVLLLCFIGLFIGLIIGGGIGFYFLAKSNQKLENLKTADSLLLDSVIQLKDSLQNLTTNPIETNDTIDIQDTTKINNQVQEQQNVKQNQTTKNNTKTNTSETKVKTNITTSKVQNKPATQTTTTSNNTNKNKK